MSKYKPVKGDRVRVVLEGEVRGTNDKYTMVGNDAGWFAEIEHAHSDATFEKIEPPVTVFKPGDVVRHCAGCLWLVVEGGVRSITGTASNPGDFCTERPTSKHYELVSLG